MKNGWISVKDRLPEKGVKVLAYNNIEVICGCMRPHYSTEHFFDDVYGLTPMESITHWQPLPGPPE